MNKKKIIIIAALIVLGGVGVFLSQWFMPHRDVQNSAVDIHITATNLVSEYLEDPTKSNAKYLQSEGDSKILAVTGQITSMEEDMKHQKVIYLASTTEAKVSCTFTSETNNEVANLKVGDQVEVKGVIRSGATYDEDLEMYEDVIMEKCAILNK